VTVRTGQARETSGAIDFDAALEAYFETGDAEELLCAGSTGVGLPGVAGPEHAEAIAAVTGCARAPVD
jgi:hypothetical protein